MTASIFCAKYSASSDLPEAVGPVITINFAAMSFIANIIAAPGKALKNETIQQIAQLLDSVQIEICGDARTAKIVCARKIAISAEYGVDILYTSKENAPFKLLVCDMESTIISNEFLDEIADYLGIGKQVEEITARAMNGELNFQESLFARIELVKGLTLADAQKLITERLKYNPGAKELVQGCKGQGVHTMLVSGGFTIFTQVVADALGFHEHFANNLIFENGKLVGVAPPILGKEAKLAITTNKCAELGISLEQAITMGDGANDLPMLHAAGLGVGYFAKPKVKAEIFSQINHGSLATILEVLN